MLLRHLTKGCWRDGSNLPCARSPWSHFLFTTGTASPRPGVKHGIEISSHDYVWELDEWVRIFLIAYIPAFCSFFLGARCMVQGAWCMVQGAGFPIDLAAVPLWDAHPEGRVGQVLTLAPKNQHKFLMGYFSLVIPSKCMVAELKGPAYKRTELRPRETRRGDWYRWLDMWTIFILLWLMSLPMYSSIW